MLSDLHIWNYLIYYTLNRGGMYFIIILILQMGNWITEILIQLVTEESWIQTRALWLLYLCSKLLDNIAVAIDW